MLTNSTPSLSKNELHVWRYRVSNEDYLNECKNPVLSEEEKTRCSEFLYEKDKLKYTCNHVFRRSVLAKYLGIEPAQVEYNYNRFGKPFFAKSELQFSHSYRNDVGLLAVYNGSEVGIDIEREKELHDVLTFANFSFSEAEKAMIFANGKFNETTFFTFWTFKESFIKAIGTGLNADIRQFDLADFMHQEIKELPFGGNANWIIKKLSAPKGYKAAYAVKGIVERLIEFNYN